MTDNNNKKQRIQFDLTPEALKELDELKTRAQLATRAELVRNALRLYSWFLDKRRGGSKILLREGDDIREVEFVSL